MQFTWVPYYKELAQKLVQYKDKQEELLSIIRGLPRDYIDFLQKDSDGTKITCIHPFAIYSIFSRLFLIEKKQEIFNYLKQKLNLSSPIPDDFDGIPSVNPRKSFWGISWDKDSTELKEQNWDLFCCANEEPLNKEKFCNCFDKVITQNGAKWNVTQALFRMAPDRFLSLDSNSREYLESQNITVFNEKELSGDEYLRFIDIVRAEIESRTIKDKDFVELSYNAWKYGEGKVNYWLIAPGTNAGKWDEYLKNGEIGIGWDELGNLETYKNIDKVRDKYIEIWHSDNKEFSSNAPKQVWDFYKNIQIGDVILARKGVRQIVGMGRVTSDYFYDNNRDEFFHLRKVDWIKVGEWEYPGQSTRDTVHRLKTEQVREILKTMDEKSNANTIKLTELLKSNYNIILHGAPGTGKTYLAKDIAAQMICQKPFEEIEKDPDSLKTFNEQIEFVQFHPSYDYSDFVEGLRPVEGVKGEIGFERKDGIFKAFCAKALEMEKTGVIDNFDEALNKFLQVMADEEDGVEIPLLNGNGTFRIKLNSYGDGFVTLIPKKDGSQGYEKDSSRFFNFNQCHRVYQGKPGYLNGGTGFDNYRRAIVNELERNYGLLKYTGGTGTPSKNDKPYIFIIDEINRGEISKIFGELFFSIDPGYRGVKGKVRTQYSNMMKGKNEFDQVLGVGSTFGNFFIPNNVYIIGTMNDIDRSVESMDFAMRRRFVFEEVTAEDSAKNMNLSQEATDRMTRINAVIHDTEGLNDAYKIGGAYFLDVSDFDQLWKIKLSSLIKEYLRGIDDDGSKFKKIQDAYFNNEIDSLSDNDE